MSSKDHPARLVLIAREWFDLSDLVTEVGLDASREGLARGREVRCDIAHDLPLSGDYELIRSALENVVRNALRYTPAGSAVEITLHRQNNGDARIAISDSGPGVPEPELKSIFRPFYRVDKARTPGAEGFGVGLAIAERAVRLHHGSITAMNRSPQGLMVEIYLPTPRAIAEILGSNRKRPVELRNERAKSPNSKSGTEHRATVYENSSPKISQRMKPAATPIVCFLDAQVRKST